MRDNRRGDSGIRLNDPKAKFILFLRKSNIKAVPNTLMNKLRSGKIIKTITYEKKFKKNR